MVEPSLPRARPCILLGGLSAAMLAIAWWETSSLLRVGDQSDWAVVGLAGTSGIMLAVVLWVLSARQAVERRLAGVLARLEPLQAPNAGPHREWPIAEALVATKPMARYHRACCPLAAGKAVTEAGQAVHEAAGRQPCDVCRP